MLASDVLGEDAGIVAMAMDRARVGRQTVLAQAGGPLGDGAGEIDARHRRALPVSRLRGQATLPEGADTEPGEILQGGLERGCRDHLVGLEHVLSASCAEAGIDLVAAA